MPANAISGEGPFVTADGVAVRVKYLATWNNKDGRYDDELDRLCMDAWNVPFRFLRSSWIARLRDIDNYWHLVELEKI